MSYLNLVAQPAERRCAWWGRVIFYVADVDERVRANQLLRPATPKWGERFFHLIDPDGHELSSHALCGPRCDSHEIGYCLS